MARLRRQKCFLEVLLCIPTEGILNSTTRRGGICLQAIIRSKEPGRVCKQIWRGERQAHLTLVTS